MKWVYVTYAPNLDPKSTARVVYYVLPARVLEQRTDRLNFQYSARHGADLDILSNR